MRAAFQPLAPPPPALVYTATMFMPYRPCAAAAAAAAARCRGALQPRCPATAHHQLPAWPSACSSWPRHGAHLHAMATLPAPPASPQHRRPPGSSRRRGLRESRGIPPTAARTAKPSWARTGLLPFPAADASQASLGEARSQRKDAKAKEESLLHGQRSRLQPRTTHPAGCSQERTLQRAGGNPKPPNSTNTTSTGKTASNSHSEQLLELEKSSTAKVPVPTESPRSLTPQTQRGAGEIWFQKAAMERSSGNANSRRGTFRNPKIVVPSRARQQVCVRVSTSSWSSPT
uniref:Uncharacterized protein n=1 Tax=Malurus cyaneus samueli TaxID=2593467 RepID=A0A8C5U4A7_9PASS